MTVNIITYLNSSLAAGSCFLGDGLYGIVFLDGVYWCVGDELHPVEDSGEER